MQINTEQVKIYIGNQLAQLITNISLQNSIQLTNINRSAEDFFEPILNITYGLGLRNLNSVQANYPAIDLGDMVNKIAVQVTSDPSSTKFKKTIATFKAHNLEELFSQLWFLILSLDKKTSSSDPHVTTNLINITDLYKDICKLQPEKLLWIKDYIDRELYTAPTRTTYNSIVPPTPKSISVMQPAALIEFLDFGDMPEEIANLDIDLAALLNKLKNIPQNQREFIADILSKAMLPAYNKVVIAIDKVAGFYPYDYQTLIDPLILEGLAYIDHEFEPFGSYDSRPITVLELYFSGKVDDINLFASIADFSQQDKQILNNIFVDLNFSYLA